MDVKQLENLDVLIVGHNVAAKCDVTNSILGYKTDIKHFQCRKLIVKQAPCRTFITKAIRVALGPNLDTPAWVEMRGRIKSNFWNRVFVYVKDIGHFAVEDSVSIQNIRKHFGKSSDIILVLYHDEETTASAEQSCQNLVSEFDGNFICIKRSHPKNKKVQISKHILRVAMNCAILNEYNRHKLGKWINIGKGMILQVPVVKPTQVETETKRSNLSHNMNEFETRLKTFRTWPQDAHIAPPLLANAGFIYTGCKDECQCITCKVCLSKWTYLHDPWAEHLRWFPECAFLEQVWGRQTIENRLKELYQRNEGAVDVETDQGSASKGTPVAKNKSRLQDYTSGRPKTPDNIVVEMKNEHLQLYLYALKFGKVSSYHTRVSLIGYQGAGKTTLVKRLQNSDVKCPNKNSHPTECLAIDQTATRVMESNGTRYWETNTEGYDTDKNYERMAKAMHDCLPAMSKVQTDQLHNVLESETGEVYDVTSWSTREYEPSGLESTELGSDETEEFEANEKTKQYVEFVLKKMNGSPGEKMYVTYWDFAGQITYYTTHQAFMSPCAVYLLVVDLSKPLEFSFRDSLQFRTHHTEHASVLDTILYWTGSIKAYTSDKNGSHAPVIVVGTHRDKVNQETTDTMFEKIRKTMKIEDLQCIAVDNTDPAVNDASFEELKDKIIDESMGIIDTEIPAAWLGLEYSILQRKADGETVMKFKELEDIDREADLPMNDPARLKNFLEYEHSKGLLMYFPQGEMKKLIILNPLLLIDFINMLLRRKPKMSTRLNLKVKDFGWCSDGIFDRKFIDQSIRQEESVLRQNIDNIVDLFTFLKIIHCQKTTNQKNQFYFMPCLLEEKPQDKLVASRPRCKKTPSIKISFDDRMIPPAFFHSLIAALLSKWQPQKENDNDDIRMYNRYACFCIDGETNLLEIYWEDSNIFLHVISFTVNCELSDLNIEDIIDFIMLQADEILKTYKQTSIACSVSVCCPEHVTPPSYVSLTSLIEKKNSLCTPLDREEQHGVTDEMVLKGWFRKYFDSKEEKPCEERPKMDLNERCIGRLCRKLKFHDANSLTNTLRMENAYLVAEQAIHDSNKNKEYSLFIAMWLWKKRNAENATVGKLLKMLTRTKDYQIEELEKAMTEDCSKYTKEKVPNEVLDKTIDEKQCVKYSKMIIPNQVPLLFIELGLDYVSIQDVHHSREPICNGIASLLRQWKRENHENATLRSFLNTASRFDVDVKKIVDELLAQE